MGSGDWAWALAFAGHSASVAITTKSSLRMHDRSRDTARKYACPGKRVCMLVGLALGAALLAPPAGFTPDVAAARAYAAQRPGTIAFAVRTEGRFWGFHADRAFP